MMSLMTYEVFLCAGFESQMLSTTFLKLTKHYTIFFFFFWLHLSDNKVGGCIMFMFVAVCRSACACLHVYMDLCD